MHATNDREGRDDAVLLPATAETFVEKACGFLTSAAIVVMLVVIVVDIFTRSILHFSFEISDEVASYALVAVTFLSLSVGQANHSFHRVEFIQARLPPRGQSISRIIFGLLSLCACTLLLWQFIRLGLSSHRSGVVAPTRLMTPLWLPQSIMVIGMAALLFSVARTLVADTRMLIAGDNKGAGKP